MVRHFVTWKRGTFYHITSIPWWIPVNSVLSKPLLTHRIRLKTVEVYNNLNKSAIKQHFWFYMIIRFAVLHFHAALIFGKSIKIRFMERVLTNRSPFLGAFIKFLKTTIRVVMSVCLSVSPSLRMEPPSCHWMDFRKICISVFFENVSKKLKF